MTWGSKPLCDLAANLMGQPVVLITRRSWTLLPIYHHPLNYCGSRLPSVNAHPPILPLADAYVDPVDKFKFNLGMALCDCPATKQITQNILVLYLGKLHGLFGKHRPRRSLQTPAKRTALAM